MVTPGRSCAMWSNPHDFIEFPFCLKENIFAKTAPLYEQGLSLREIELRTGIPKTTIRKALMRGDVSLRATETERRSHGWRNSGKRGVKPPYGFCYLEGEITRHPKEYSVLKIIHERWKQGQPANSIATWLNGKKIPSPMGKSWSWNSVTNIINRFKSKTIVIKGGSYELR